MATSRRRIALVVTLAAVVSPTAKAAEPVLLRGTVVTMDATHQVIRRGRVLVRDGMVTAIWTGPRPESITARGVRVVNAGPRGLIFPGLINLHDHPTFDILPTWLPPSSHAQPGRGRPTGREPYANRYQWNTDSPAAYDRLVGSPRNALASLDALGMQSEVLVRAEARAALGGQTASQGAPPDPTADSVLVRTVDGGNFGRDRVESRVSAIGDPDFAGLPAIGIRLRMASGQLDTWLVHLAEGVRDASRPAVDPTSSRNEFEVLRERGLLTDATAIVHGIALERSDFATMRRAPSAQIPGVGKRLGAQLVWSPLSNLLLYGETAQVYEALAEDVIVSLGTDWTPSGSNTLLDELKIADVALRDPRILGRERHLVPALRPERALDRALVDMVTRNPAMTLNWEEVGSIEPGSHADLLMLRRPRRSPTGGLPASPYRSLIDAGERNIRLVMVDGDPIVGDPGLMRALRGRDMEVVRSTTGKFRKAIDVTRADTPRGNAQLADISLRLARGLRALGGDGARPGSGLSPSGARHTYLRRHWGGGQFATMSDREFNRRVLVPRFGTLGQRLNLEAIRIRPLFSEDDEFLLRLLGDRRPVDSSPPFHLYRANLNHIGPRGNPYAQRHFADRWYR